MSVQGLVFFYLIIIQKIYVWCKDMKEALLDINSVVGIRLEKVIKIRFVIVFLSYSSIQRLRERDFGGILLMIFYVEGWRIRVV